MTVGLDPEIVIFDTEYTTWEGAMARAWSGPGEYREIVQIGALRAETQGFTEQGTLTLFVRPVKNPQLSDYFMQLTGITQAQADAGLSLQDALTRFDAWAGGRTCYCWGSDMSLMKENAELVGVPFPPRLERWSNMRDLFTAHGVDAENYMSSTIPRAFGEEPPPHGHDALNDARSILQALRALARKSETLV